MSKQGNGKEYLSKTSFINTQIHTHKKLTANPTSSHAPCAQPFKGTKITQSPSLIMIPSRPIKLYEMRFVQETFKLG